MRRALVLAMVAVVAVVLFAHDVPLAAHLRQVERDRLVTSLERDAFLIAGLAENDIHDRPSTEPTADPTAEPTPDPQDSSATNAAPGEPPYEGRDLQAAIEQYQRVDGARVIIVNQSGVGVMTSDGNGVGDDFTNRPEILDALSGRPAAGSRESKTLNANLFYVAVPVFSAEGPVGAVRLTVLDDEVDQRANRRVRGIFLVAGLSLLMATLVAWVVAGRLSKPIETLRRTTQRVADGDLSARARDDEGPPEVRALAESMNTMTARLALLIERQRSFAGTASHQLRTPLTALRLRLEALGDAVDPATPVGKSVEAARAETDRLHLMIEGLLALARAEGSSTKCEPLPLGALALDRVEHWLPLAEEREVVIDATAVEQGVTVDAVPGSLEQILDNLIDNALEVAPPGSTIRVETRSVAVSRGTGPGRSAEAQAADRVELHVIDEGPGLTDEQRDQAFERFWRGPNAGHGGTGLGLAIVRQLAEASGGTAELGRSSSGGIDATVTFRRASRAQLDLTSST